ncbi:hypothetical protein THAOC_01157, partial [Thalassiosira oceanica]
LESKESLEAIAELNLFWSATRPRFRPALLCLIRMFEAQSHPHKAVRGALHSFGPRCDTTTQCPPAHPCQVNRIQSKASMMLEIHDSIM